MFESLQSRHQNGKRDRMDPAYSHEELTPEKPIPGIIGIVGHVCVKEQRPLISLDGHLTALEFRFHAMNTL
jgi:hypothetical protein